MRHMGNLTVTKETALDFPAVTSFFGHLTVDEGVELRAPSLTNLRGWLTVMPGASFAAPMLGRIEGWLTLRDSSSMMAEHLTEITAALVIGSRVNLDLRALQSLGSVLLQRGANHELDMQSVRDFATVGPYSTLLAPHLGQIGGSITLGEYGRLTAPLLAHIGGFYDADPTAVLHAPNFGG